MPSQVETWGEGNVWKKEGKKNIIIEYTVHQFDLILSKHSLLPSMASCWSVSKILFFICYSIFRGMWWKERAHFLCFSWSAVWLFAVNWQNKLWVVDFSVRDRDVAWKEFLVWNSFCLRQHRRPLVVAPQVGPRGHFGTILSDTSGVVGGLQSLDLFVLNAYVVSSFPEYL